jgi:hypothetical protein
MESPGNEGDHQDDEVVDWDEKETQLALFNSRFVPFLFLKYIYSTLYLVITPFIPRILQKDQAIKL